MSPYLSVIIPAFNEEARIQKTLAAVVRFLRAKPYEWEVIVVDDGSTDNTMAVVRTVEAAEPRVRHIALPNNQGKGAAVQIGMLDAQGEARLFMDADNSTSIEQVDTLLPFLDAHDVVIGSRRITSAKILVPQPLFREALGFAFRIITRILVPLPVVDSQNGFKLFSKRAAELLFSKLQTKGWSFDVEILLRAKHLGLRIKEVPIIWINDFSSRLRAKDVVKMLFELLRIRLLGNNRSDAGVARILAAGCVALYLLVFGAVFLAGSANGTSLGKMVGLEFSDMADTTEYVHLAQNMLDVGRFSITPDGPPEFLRVPGYPIFLALVLVIFKTLTVVPLLQLLVTACTVALIYLIGARYFPRSVAVAAALIYMVDPIVMYAAWTPITESFFMLFLTLSVYAIGARSRHPWLPYAAAGVFLALSVYMRPIGLYVAPLVACMALAHRESWRAAARNIAIFFIALACLVVPWMVRNYSLSGHFAFSSVSGYNLYAVNMPLFEQVRTGTSYFEIAKKYSIDGLYVPRDEDALRDFSYTAEETAIAKEVILAHPFQYALFHILKSIQYFFGSSIVNVTYHMHVFGILPGEHAQGEGAWGMLTQHRWGDAFVQVFTHIPRLIERILWVLAYCAAVGATVFALRRRGEYVWWVVCAFLILNAFAALTGPSSDDTRYRMPAEPFLLILASWGAFLAWKRFRTFRRRDTSIR